MKIVSAAVSLLFLSASTLAVSGGRCSNNWGDDCICLDSGVCENDYGGTAYSGSPGNYPCPSDPNNIMACVIKPCPQVGGNTECLWSDGCGSVNPAPVCPGGNDFVCCNL